MGSMLEGNCVRCRGSSGCLPDGSARVTIELHGLDFSALVPGRQAKLRSAVAEDIAAAVGVDVSSVVDLHGESSTVTISAVGAVNAFALGIEGSSANDLAARLYGDSFRTMLVNSMSAALGDDSGAARVGAIVVRPEHFTPVARTTVTTTETATTTYTQTETETTSETTSARIHDVVQTSKRDATPSNDAPLPGLAAAWLALAVAALSVRV